MAGLVEAVPNLSEGRRPEVVAQVVEAVACVPGVRLLDWSSDASHNRSVITFAGEAHVVREAIVGLVERAVAAIDLRVHTGQHPRIGAVDVVPFVPLTGAAMGDCVALAQETGREVARRFGVPVYLYAEAATDPRRRALEHVRRGQFEGLAEKMASPGWSPDFGPARPHPSAGAMVIGARHPLIAFNVNLASDRLDIARAIARTVRERDGGLPAVKALGLTLADRGIVQVSMNLTNYRQTSILQAFKAVEAEAQRRGVRPLEGEIIGLVPAEALEGVDLRALMLSAPVEDKILEHRLRGVKGPPAI